VSESLRSVSVITLFVADPQRSKEFYERAFGVPTVFEDANSAIVKFDNLMVNLLEQSHAPELIVPAPVETRGSRFMPTIFVADVDAVCSGLAGRGVELLNGPLDRPWGMRTAAFADPDGHVWEVAQELARSAA